MRFVEQNKKRIDPRYFSEEILKEESVDLKSTLNALNISTTPFDQTKFTAAERNKIMRLINARREGEVTDEQIRIAIDVANRNAQMRAAQPAQQMTAQQKQAAEKSKQDLRKKSVMGAFTDDAQKMFKSGPDSEDVTKKAFAGTGGAPDPSKMPGSSPKISTKPLEEKATEAVFTKDKNQRREERLAKVAKLQEAKSVMLHNALIKALND